MLFREAVAVQCENHMKHTDTPCGQNPELNVLKQEVHTELLGFKWLRCHRRGAIQENVPL
jgi:hypothetical protein